MPKQIVAMGGGNAMPKAVLAGLKQFDVELTAVCAMLDSGGSSGRLRKDYKIMAPGDIRRAFLALANTSPVVENLFNYRFEAGELKGHNFANLLIAALELSTGDYKQTIETMNRILDVKHKVLPVTLDKSELCVVLENGETIIGETNIDKPKHNSNLKIEKIYLSPEPNAYPEALESIEKADLIIIGPGDLYSSLAQILLCKGVKEAIQATKAKIVYVVNLMTKLGETNKFSVNDFVKEIENMINRKLDFVLCNNNIPSKEKIKIYLAKHSELIEMTKIDIDTKDKRFIQADLLDEENLAHNTEKLSKLIFKLCKQ
ncbi:YvcK family protein [Patescibacteria group bacterium]|nr:YvcK family protein [Patescibacteria group bacterium]